jgi:DNA recombination protein RmuC
MAAMEIAILALLVAVAAGLFLLVPPLAARRAAAAVEAALAGRLDGLDRALERLERGTREELARGRGEADARAHREREELRAVLREGADGTAASLKAFGERLDGFRATVDERLRASHEDAGKRLDLGRQETARALKDLGDSVAQRLAESAAAQKGALDGFGGHILRLTEASEKRLGEVRAAVEAKLAALQADNAERLERMRATVDEKLQGTLEKRLGESFKLVSDRLEAVQRGLGEMQSLATGVGDLKKVLTNVKARGTFGEVQLGNLLEQVLAPAQYAVNVATRRDSGERVEFALRLPGRDGEEEVLLPIDAKFPTEDYQRLVEAADRGDREALEAAAKALENRVWGCAKDISEKYLNPPRTTDFGILFLPTEGLFAEVVRRPGLVEELQRDLKVTVAGPTTLTAMLNALQMGFRTLAIQKRSSEVWSVLGAVKAEWGKFGEVLQKVEKKLGDASKTLHEVGTRQRAIDRKLRDVQELPAPEAQALLPELGLVDPAAEAEPDGVGAERV